MSRLQTACADYLKLNITTNVFQQKFSKLCVQKYNRSFERADLKLLCVVKQAAGALFL